MGEWGIRAGGGDKEILPPGLIGKVPFYGSPKCPGGKKGAEGGVDLARVLPEEGALISVKSL